MSLMFAPLPADLGCEEITDESTPRGQRAFRCAWDDRVRIAHTLLGAFGNVEITGEGPIIGEHGDVRGYESARIVAGTRIA